MSETMTIQDELKIDEANLDRELADHSARYVYHAEKSVSAEMAYNEFKMKVGELYAMVDYEVRSRAEADGKKVTEKVVENAVLSNEDYKKANLHLFKLKANMDILKARREGFKERGSMLVQLCAMKRTEMETIGFDRIKAMAM